jgi:hypothetical protein
MNSEEFIILINKISGLLDIIKTVSERSDILSERISMMRDRIENLENQINQIKQL